MQVEDLQTIAVIGLGKMGGDWVVNLLEGGYRIIGFDSSEKTLETIGKRLKKGLEWVAKNKDKGEGFVQDAEARFSLAESEQDFIEKAQKAQVLLEVVFEDIKLKCDLFSRMAPQLPEEIMIWTNTSSLSIREMAISSERPQKFIGTHGMNPVYRMPAVEVIRHQDLDQSILKFTLDVLTKLGKIPFIAADVPGFWVNKQLIPFALEAMRSLERGEITVEDGDKGLKNSLGHPQGVFKLSDFIGNDTFYRVTMALYMATQDPRYYPPAILTRMFKNEEWGVKSGKGFYLWEGFKVKSAVDFSDRQIKDSSTILEV